MLKHIVNEISPPVVKRIYKKLFGAKKVFKPEWHVINGFRFYFDKSTELGKEYIRGYDNFIYEEFKSGKEDRQIIYDLGAHFGYHTLRMISLFPNNSIVYSFEPNPENGKRLLMNINENDKLKDRIKVFSQALSDSEGEVVFEIYKNIEEGTSSASHINFNSSSPEKKSIFSEEIAVRTIPLDKLIDEEKLELPTIIKMDIEGAESKALQGAKSTIAKCRPLLFVEIHDILNMYEVLCFFLEISYGHKLLHTESDGRCFIKFYPKESI